MIRLEIGGDFVCPSCGQGWNVDDWGTEYNAPIIGVSQVHCSSCDTKFNIEVERIIRITVLE